MGSDTTHISAVHSSDGTTSPSATTWLANNSVPAGGTAARQVYWEGVTFDSSVDKTTPAGSQSSKNHGRQMTRGWGDGGNSASHPRGVQEKTSRQMPCQEGDLPSGATPNIPPTTVPESTLPQWGGWARTLPGESA